VLDWNVEGAVPTAGTVLIPFGHTMLFTVSLIFDLVFAVAVGGTSALGVTQTMTYHDGVDKST
jgi:hypothetical protein